MVQIAIESAIESAAEIAAEGNGKTAEADRRLYFEIARGSIAISRKKVLYRESYHSP